MKSGTYSLLFLFLGLIQSLPSNAQVPEIEIEELETDWHSEIAQEPQFSPAELYGYYASDGKFGLQINDSQLTKAIYDNIILIRDKGFIVTIDQKFGFVNRDGKTIIPIKYNSISYLDGRLIVQKKELVGVYDLQGKRVLPVKYKKFFGANALGQIVVQDKKGNLQLINTNGKVALENFERIELMRYGAIYKKEGKFGFFLSSINTGFVYDTLCLSSSYDAKNARRNSRMNEYGSNSSYAFTMVAALGEKIGLIDTLNHVLIPIELDDIKLERYKAYYLLTQGKKKGFYLPNIQKYIAPQYDEVYMDGISYLHVVDGRKRGLISNVTGEMILPVEYDKIYYVTRSVNATNQVIVPLEYESIYDFEDRFFLAQRNNLYGLLSLNGHMIQEPQYTSIQGGSRTRDKAHICLKNSLFGVLNKDGTNYLKNEFRSIGSIFSTTRDLELPDRRATDHYLTLTHLSGKVGVINMSRGVLEIPVEYELVCQRINMEGADSALFVAKKDGKYGLIDAENRILVDFVYDTLDAFGIPRIEKDSPLADYSMVAKRNGKFGVITLYVKVHSLFKFTHLWRYPYS